MGDWSGINLGDDGLDLNLSYSEPPAPPRPKTNTKTAKKSTSTTKKILKGSASTSGASASRTKEVDMKINPFKIDKNHLRKKTTTAKSVTTGRRDITTKSSSTASLRQQTPENNNEITSEDNNNENISNKYDGSQFAADVKAPIDSVENLTSATSSERATSTSVKHKHVVTAVIEDPHQYHAKPSDLSKNALKRPRPLASSSSSRSVTFFYSHMSLIFIT